ncbi:MAG: diaminopropionate ammonia-lyase [Granulosicoccaceae bacterium]
MTNSLFANIQDAIKIKDQWIGNPTASRYPNEVDAQIPAASMATAQTEIKSWPIYQATALLELPEVAQQAGVAKVLYKDESTRFGLGSFKALGGAYAVLQYLAARVSEQLGTDVTMESIRLGEHKDTVGSMMVTTATDGNHGRSVAWGAQLAGCQCRIYIHKNVSVAREQAMAELGAKVIRITGNYDESVKLCASDANKNDWQMVSDTSYEGYTSIPTQIMSGYSVMIAEILKQSSTVPTHVFIQAGVGGLAAAVAAGFWSRLGETCPKIIVVESEHADCIIRSLKAGTPTPVDIKTETIMAGLSCGEISLIAWEVLKRCAAGAVSINDAAVPPTMRYMASGDASKGTKIEAGECAVPGIIALLASAQNNELNKAFAIDKNSTVLVFGCEGATDPELYNSILANER